MKPTILDTLRTLATVEDYDREIPNLETAISDGRANHAQLLQQRSTVIFDGGDMAKLQAEIRAAEDLVEVLESALTGAQERRTAAAEVEENDANGEIYEKALDHQSALVGACRDFDAAAKELAATGQKIQDLTADIERANAALKESGFPLVCSNPVGQGRVWIGHMSRGLALDFKIPDYWPLIENPKDGSVLQALHAFEEGRPDDADQRFERNQTSFSPPLPLRKEEDRPSVVMMGDPTGQSIAVPSARR